MSYGHADKLARSGAERDDRRSPADPPEAKQKAEPTGPDASPPVSPGWYARPELVPVLTGHDVGALFRALGEIGVSQRRIARLTGRSQPNIAEIFHGRRVMSYAVLVAITEGLGVPPERMGLSWWGPDGRWYGPQDAYPEGVAAARTPEGVTLDMLRRHLIALGGSIMVGAPVARVGELLGDLGELPPAPLPSRLTGAHVAQVRDLTRRLDESAMALGCNPEVSNAATDLATRLLDLPGAESARLAMMVAIAQLRLQAGWAAFDAGLYRHALHHFARALELATAAGDAYCQALALNYAGLVSIEHGHPNDGLKMLQAARVRAWDIPPEPRPGVVVLGEGSRVAVEACGLADSATALVAMGQSRQAYRHVGTARELWSATSADAAGDLDRVAAHLEIHRGRLDVAEQLAAASVQRWAGVSQVGRINSGVVLATVHVKAGESRGLQLAHNAIIEVTRLTSVRVRKQLGPLVDALEARPGSDAQELARLARQVAA